MTMAMHQKEKTTRQIEIKAVNHEAQSFVVV
jgi:hypothetical protein